MRKTDSKGRVMYSMYMPYEVWLRLRELSHREFRPMSDIILEAVVLYLKENYRREKGETDGGQRQAHNG